MNTRKRLAAMMAAGAVPRDAAVVRTAGAHGNVPHDVLHNPACVIGPGQRCQHPLVDAELNRRLFAYESVVRGRFTAIVDTLKTLSACQHELDFVERAQRIARDRLGYELPAELLGEAWVSGLNLRALHSYCIFNSFRLSVDNADADQAAWRERMTLDEGFIADCGFHSVDISPCADGRLQGLLPFVFRMTPADNISVKAYAGALFDIDTDMTDWTQRELLRLAGGIADGERLNYLKIAAYHYSSSHGGDQGCAAHGSNDTAAIDAALSRLNALRAAIDNTYGRGAAPAILLVGIDTDVDAIRVHLPDANGDVNPYRYVESGALYRDTVGMSVDAARDAIYDAVTRAEAADGWAQGDGAMDEGMRYFVLRLIEANFSQIEYVIHHHAGRYAVIGHDEEFICAGEAIDSVQMRNKYYYAHLDTVEEGAPDMDVGIKIFTGLNIRHGLAVPLLVHFHYSSRVPGARERAVLRARRVKDAIEARYPQLVSQGLINCQMAVSDHHGSERCAFVYDAVVDAGH